MSDTGTIHVAVPMASKWRLELSHIITKQESLANAKVSARQPWYIVRNSLNRPPLRIAQQYQRNLYIVEKYFQCTTIPSLTMRVYLHSFSHCSLSNMPISAKFQEKLNVQQFKVIQGRWFWYQSKAHMRLPISHYSNFGPILHRFWDTATYYWLKIAHFSYPSLIRRPFLIRRPRSLSSLWNFAVKLSVGKLESWGYSVVKIAWS